MFLCVANGITTVRSLLGEPGLLALQGTVTDGSLLGPGLYLADPANTFLTNPLTNRWTKPLKKSVTNLLTNFVKKRLTNSLTKHVKKRLTKFAGAKTPQISPAITRPPLRTPGEPSTALPPGFGGDGPLRESSPRKSCRVLPCRRASLRTSRSP